MKTRIGTTALLAAVGVLMVSSAFAQTTVRGRLDQYSSAGLSPATFVQVTLTANGQDVVSAVTGSDGMYYLRGVSPGACTLRIWLQDVGDTSGGGPMQYEVRASAEKYTNVRPILVNRVSFDSPDTGYACPAGAKLTFVGTHTFPGGAPVALVLRTTDDKYIRLKPTLDIVPGRSWRLANVPIAAGTAEVLAVLFADEPAVKVSPLVGKLHLYSVQTFRSPAEYAIEPGMSVEQSWEGQQALDALPKSATVVASRKIVVGPHPPRTTH